MTRQLGCKRGAWRNWAWLGWALVGLGLSGCGGLTRQKASAPVYLSEQFQADEKFSRLFDGTEAQTCEAARRTLLSQGYIITLAEPAQIRAVKRFQPEGEVHVEIGFNVVCVPDPRDAHIATAYVSAQQERYVVKKSTTSTSLGVSAIGSISVPLTSTQDSLVKVASETIPSQEFYDRFFALLAQSLRELTDTRR